MRKMKQPSIRKDFRKHCRGCKSYENANAVGIGCRMAKKARDKCPCGTCLVKVACEKYCDLFYEIQIKEKGIIY